MMFVWTNENANLTTCSDSGGNTQQADKTVEPCSRAGAGKDDRMFSTRPAMRGNCSACLTAQPRHHTSAIGGFRMAVGIIGQNAFENEFFDLPKRATRSHIIG